MKSTAPVCGLRQAAPTTLWLRRQTWPLHPGVANLFSCAEEGKDSRTRRGGVKFAVVVIGGMGSILGAIVSGFALGLVEGLKVFYPEASSPVIFAVMALVLLIKPAGSFGRAR
jgi:Branched-chain amino acid transport system / permease component